MRGEGFPQPSKTQGQKIIKALTEKDPDSADNLAALADVNYIPTPKRIDKKEKPQYFVPKIEKLIVEAHRGSVSFAIFEILNTRYPKMHITLQPIKLEGKLEANLFSLETNNDAELVSRVLSEPVIQILEMNDPDDDFEMGIDLEKNGLLENGITEKIYVKFLKRRIKEYKKSKNLGSKELAELYKKEIIEKGLSDVQPLTGEEERALIEQAIIKVFEGGR